jgi:oligogalacturonide lyase
LRISETVIVKKPALSLCSLLACLAISPAAANDVGRTFPSEKRIVIDKVTGAKLQLLTDDPAGGDSKIYQTHPQWAHDGRHVIFRSSKRSADGNAQAFAVDEVSGSIVQLTDGADVMTGSLNVARLTNELFYLRKSEGRWQLYAVDLEAVFRLAAAGRKRDGRFERRVATLPADYRDSGGWTLDANEKTAYFGVSRSEAPPRLPGQPVPQVPGGVRALDLKTGAWRTVIDAPFRMGHVQANPWIPGEILYCWETGGDAPQRMWIVRSDGSRNRPLYPELPDDWVTHEVFIDKDHVMFNLMGHTPKLRQHMSGVTVVSLRDGTTENVGQTNWAEGRSFWHSGATPDGRWGLADDWNGTVWLLDRTNGQRTMLSTGHMMTPDHNHGDFSPDGTRILIQSGMLSEGKKLDLMTVPLPAWAIQRAPTGTTK